MVTTTSKPVAGPRTGLVMATLGFVAFAYSSQQTAVIPAINTIKHGLHASSAWSAWPFSGYLVVTTVLTSVFGHLGHLRGRPACC